MINNLTDLRNQVYRLWNIDNFKVIHNFPKSTRYHGKEFSFQLDFSKRSKGWPKAYALSYGDEDPSVRIVTPILVLKPSQSGMMNMTNSEFKVPMWLDTSIEMHETLIELFGDTEIEGQTAHKIFGKTCLRKKVVAKENYIYGLSQINNQLSLRLIKDVNCY